MQYGLLLLLALFIIKCAQYPAMWNMYTHSHRPRRRNIAAAVIILSLASDLILLAVILKKL